MEKSIIFPNIGLELNNVGQSITIFGFEIAFYGIIIALGVMAGVLIAALEAKRTGQNPETYFDMAIYAVIFSIIGARIYYVIFSWDQYKDDLLQIFNIRQGGLAIYGGVIAAVITVFLFGKIKKLSWLQLMDTAIMGLIAGQMIGRWGNFFNREAFGDYTNSLLAMQLPLESVRAGDVTDLMMENLVNVGGMDFIQVHPTFLYESLWNLGVLLFLFWFKTRKKFQGEMMLCYFIGYGIGRFWIEGLRTDQLQIANGWAISQIVAVAMVVISLGIIIVTRMKIKKTNYQ